MDILHMWQEEECPFTAKFNKINHVDLDFLYRKASSYVELRDFGICLPHLV